MHRRVLQGLVLGFILPLIVDAVCARLGLVEGVLPKGSGPSFWIASRAASVTAFLALTLDVVFGLLMTTGAADAVLPRATSAQLHRFLSGASLTFSGMHMLALLGDGYMSFDVLSILFPFFAPYRPVATSLGVFALYGALLVHLSFGFKSRLGAKTWRKLHYLAFAVYAFALIHGVMAGTDTGTPFMQAVYLGSFGAVALLSAYRLWLALARRAPRRSGAHSRSL